MSNFYTEEMEKDINTLVEFFYRGEYDEAVNSSDIEAKLRNFAWNIRQKAYKEIEQEVFMCQSKWNKMDDSNAKIVCEVLTQLIARKREDIGIFKEVLVKLAE